MKSSSPFTCGQDAVRSCDEVVCGHVPRGAMMSIDSIGYIFACSRCHLVAAEETEDPILE